MKEKKKITRFLKGYPKFAYLMSNESVCFMIHLLDIEFLRKGNYNVTWPKRIFVSRMGMHKHEFDRCVNELEALGLLDVTKSMNGRYTGYHLNWVAYKRLLKVCAATIDYKRIKDFLTEIKEKGRLIRDVSDYEISKLKGYSNEYHAEAPYVKVYPGFSYLLTPDEICLLMNISEIEHLVKYHTYSFRTKQEWLDKTNMTEEAFDKAVKKMDSLHLIWKTPEDRGMIIYKHSIRGYRNLVDICGATCNYNALKDFFDWLVRKPRTLWYVKKEHIEALEKYGNHYAGMKFPFPD